MKILSGSCHPFLAEKIVRELKTELAEVEISKFPNGEKRVRILTEIKNENLFIIQSAIDDQAIIELCLLIDAAKRLKPKKIVAVLSWFGYSPQDEVYRQGEPLSAKVIAQILEASGLDETIIVDPHSRKIQSFFTIPVTILSGLQTFVAHLKKKSFNKSVVVSLDLGSMERSLQFAKALNLPLILLQKTPRDRQTGKINFMGIKGSVEAKNVFVFDDFVSTGQTLIKAVQFLKKQGAKKFTACVTHYLMVKGLPLRLEKSQIDQIYVADTLPIDQKRKFPKLKIVSIAKTIAKTISKEQNKK